MAQVLGIIGGGQLGMMLTEAAQNMSEISKVIVLDPTKDCPAAQVGAEQIVGDFRDEKSIRSLASRSDIITYEIESGDSAVLKSVQDSDVKVSPSPDTLGTIQDKLLQKTFLRENNIPVGDFVSIDSLKELKDRIETYGYPVLLKARRDAYDGRGNRMIRSKDDVADAYEYFEGNPVMLERFVDFKTEVSVIAAKSTSGEIKTFPLVENMHENSILRMTVAPGRVSSNVAKSAQQVAYDTMSVLKGAGVFGIEMFVTKDDKILINEIAPRVHNSGHHTLQSSKTSQFEQHLRAILGLELGDTDLLYHTVMHNILGPDGFSGEYEPILVSADGVYLKMYGKKESRHGRKMGHFNVVASNSTESIDMLIDRAQKVMNEIKFKPTVTS